MTDGKFYVFCNGDETNAPSVDIVDPDSGEYVFFPCDQCFFPISHFPSCKALPHAPRLYLRVTSIAVDNTTNWADTIYMEHCEDENVSTPEPQLVTPALLNTLTHI